MKKLSVTLFLLFLCFAVGAQSAAGNLSDKRRYAPDMLHVKFIDGTAVKAENGQLVITGGLPARLNSMGYWRPVHRLPAARMSELRANAERNLKKVLPDPNMNFYFIVHDPAVLTEARALISHLPGIERLQFVPVPINASTPDFFPFQSYHLDASSGINAESVWAGYGIRGAGIRICDIEYDFNPNHQDLPPVTVLGPTPVDPFGGSGTEHGTAVLGEIASLDNTWGTTGIAPDCDLYFAGSYTGGIYDLAGAITYALSELTAGDIILLEQQIDGPYYSGTPDQFGLVPVEWYELYYDAIVLAVGQNITVVEAAGNGQQDLDDPVYSIDNDGHYPFLPENNSGAIIVGAGAVDSAYNGSDTARSKLWYSNFGSRVDVQGNGEAVYTTGYGDLHSVEGYDLWYTADFGGTSGASPIVTGAVALLQAVSKTLTGNILTPAQVRNILIATGKPQKAGTYPLTSHIGPLPDVYQAALSVAAPVSIDEQEGEHSWAVFPNPGNGLLNIAGFNHPGATIKLYDARGQLLKCEQLKGSNHMLDLTAQPGGIYFVQLNSPDHTGSRKIVIVH